MGERVLTLTFGPPKVVPLNYFIMLILYHVIGVVLVLYHVILLFYVLGTPTSVLAFRKEN